jgi:hypothetical protein
MKVFFCFVFCFIKKHQNRKVPELGNHGNSDKHSGGVAFLFLSFCFLFSEGMIDQSETYVGVTWHLIYTLIYRLYKY